MINYIMVDISRSHMTKKITNLQGMTLLMISMEMFTLVILTMTQF